MPKYINYEIRWWAVNENESVERKSTRHRTNNPKQTIQSASNLLFHNGIQRSSYTPVNSSYLFHLNLVRLHHGPCISIPAFHIFYAHSLFLLLRVYPPFSLPFACVSFSPMTMCTLSLYITILLSLLFTFLFFSSCMYYYKRPILSIQQRRV